MSTLTRRTPLRRTPWLRALPEKPTKRKPRPKGPALDVVRLVVQRDGGCCVVCAFPVLDERGYGWSIHHRRGRDARPDSNRPQTLILVCGGSNVDGCHGRIHRSRREAEPYGWALTRHGNVNPLLVPCFVAALDRSVYLTAAGTYADGVTQ